MKACLFLSAAVVVGLIGCAPTQDPTAAAPEAPAPLAAEPAIEQPTGATEPTTAPAAEEAAGMVVQTAVVSVVGMDCGGCVESAAKALRTVEGFMGLKPDLQKQQLLLSFDPKKTSVAKLVDAINTGTNFEAKAI